MFWWRSVMALEHVKKTDVAKTLYDSLSRLKMGPLDNKDEQEKFYVETYGARNAEEHDRTVKTLLSIQASGNKPCHILFSGHLGCGKSTELWRLFYKLEEANFLVGMGNCEDNLDMTMLKHTDPY
jgi:signal recognition particle GTPase